MAKNLCKFFSTESFAGGGSFFADGPYRIDEARFVMYDFNGKFAGKEGNGVACLSLKLQPLDKDGADAGDQTVQYWSIGEDATIENKGKSFEMGGQYGTVWGLSDFGIFIDRMGKAGFDRDAMEDENDISVLDGQVFEFGKIPHPRSESGKGKEKADASAKGPKQLVVITGVPDAKGSKGGSSKSGSGGSKTAAKGGKKDETPDAEEMLQKFLVENVLLEKFESKGMDRIQGRMKIGKFVQAEGGDSDLTKEVTTLYNSNKSLEPILESAGWTLDGTVIKKA